MTYSAKSLAPLALLTSLSVLTACHEAEPGPGSAGLPADHPAVQAPGNGSASTAGPLAMTGVVQETLASGGYTYIRLSVAGAERWVAGPSTPLAVGDTVAVSNLMFMGEFDSPSLGRSFDELYFADGFLKPGQVPSAGGSAHPGMPMPPGAAGDADAPLVTADVTQVLEAGTFVYIEVEAEGMRQWLAAPATEVREGVRVAWRGGSLMVNFQSPSLGRTFERLLFVRGVTVVE